MEVDPAHGTTTILRDQQPGSHICIMIQTRHYNLISRLQTACQAATHMEGETGHILSEDNLFWPGRIEKVCYRLPCFCDYSVGLLAGAERASMIGIGMQEIMIHALYYLLSDLRTT